MRRPRLRTAALAVLASAAMIAAGLTGTVGTAAAGTDDVHGLKGDYYTSSGEGAFDFAHLKSTVVDANLDFDDLEPTLRSLTGQDDNVTVRWTGRIEPGHSEPYTFSMIGDNGFRLWVDHTLLIDNWVDNWNVEKTSAPIELTAGHRYDFKVEYFEHYGGSNLHLSWSSPSQPKQIVPPDAFYLPTGYDYNGPASTRVATDGKSVAMRFDHPLQPPASSAADHLSVSVSGTDWPVRSLALDADDPTVLHVDLGDPVPAKAGTAVRVAYDGDGGLRQADGTALSEFNVPADNASTAQISTRWAKDVSPSNALPDYPRPQLTRPRWKNLNGTWQYAAATAGQQPPFGKNLPERILVPYPTESQLSGIHRHDDAMWYRRTFTVPRGWLSGAHAGDRLLLHFGAVDYRAEVYLNGTRVATHTGGYTGFDVDVTDALRPTGPQELVVGVQDTTNTGTANQPIGKQRANPGGIWYTASSGIWQTVWLEPVPAAHLTTVDTTPDLADNSLRLTAHGSGVTGQHVQAIAYSGDKEVGRVSGAVGTELRLPVPHPHLWTPDDPYLYTLKVRLLDGHRIVDQVGSYFGMRSISTGMVAGQQHLLLNGKFVFQLGTLDQGFWPAGGYTAPTDAALRSDLQEQKSLGFNTVRKHVKVEPARYYYWADRLGMLVWQDMPSMDPGRPVHAADKQEFESELHAMVDQLRDHPSIVMWEPFNEGWGEYDGARIADQVKQWDPSRLVDGASGWTDTGNGDVIDNHTYVGPGHVLPSATRAAVDGEFGGLGLNVVGHTWTGGGFAYEMESNSAQLTDRYVHLMTDVRDLSAHCGLSAAIYTQPYDVEGELNGLQTYDRRVFKLDATRVRRANLAVLAAEPQPLSANCTG